MNRHIINTIFSLAVGAGLASAAEDTNVNGTLNWSSFEPIAQKNIFDPTRSGGVRPANRRRAPVVRSFTFHGTVDDVAFFTGEGAPSKGYVKAGDSIDGFKIMQINVNSNYVKLADPDGKILVLNEDQSMRREENGPWTESDQPAPDVTAPAETSSEEPAAASSPEPAGVSDILARLRARHKQEEQ
jgi:hypothetical protein